MNILPAVNSAELQSALQTASDKLDSYQETLNHISADIKTIETYLKQKSITFPFSYAMSFYLEGEEFEECLDFGVRIHGTCHQELLAWDEENDSGFRLRYVKTRRENTTKDQRGRDLPTGKEGPLEILERRPLIECKTHIRATAYNHLPKFLMGLTANLPTTTDAQDVAEYFAEEISSDKGGTI